jgi:sulfite exporter TauE/SafE
MPPDLPWILAAFLTGLTGSVHCMGMCGGMVTAMAWQGTAASIRMPGAAAMDRRALARQVAFNGGRIASYAALGAVAAGAAGIVAATSMWFPLRALLFILAQFIMILVGLQVAGVSTKIGLIERAGGAIWRRVSPFASSLVPAEHPYQAFFLGTLWGWMPCGMVYSMLLGSTGAGAPLGAALAMIAFGTGTLPAMLMTGMGAVHFREWLGRPPVRIGAGFIIVAMGVYGLVRATHLGDLQALFALCQRVAGAGSP